MTATTDAPARLPGSQPVAVIDIGSGSVRLVVYERQSRALTVLYNEKSVSGLGAGLKGSGRLSQASMDSALSAVRRFRLICKLMEVTELHPFATSATREAANGAEFAAQVSDILGAPVRILSGDEEARYALFGVQAGLPAFRGVIGDLGSGSLELGLIDGAVESRTLGVTSLLEDADGSPARAVALVQKRLRGSSVLADAPRAFCAVGGSWRALATLHQLRSRYPLHMVHGYRVPAGELLELCSQLTAGGKLPGLARIEQPRRSQLPYAAAVMAGVLRRGGFREVIFSAQGIREGYLYSLLPPEQRAVDPLLQATAELSLLRSRAPAFAADLIDGSHAFLSLLGVRETADEARLRAAACNLSDIGWRAHPEYQGEQSIDLVAFSGLVGIDHPGRAFLAETVAIRYMGLRRKTAHARVLALAGRELTRRARLLGAYFRVAYPLAAASPGILPQTRFAIDGKALVLQLPGELEFLAGERLVTRLGQLAKEAGLKKSRVAVG